jgi:hypothetical protein
MHGSEPAVRYSRGGRAPLVKLGALRGGETPLPLLSAGWSSRLLSAAGTERPCRQVKPYCIGAYRHDRHRQASAHGYQVLQGPAEAVEGLRVQEAEVPRDATLIAPSAPDGVCRPAHVLCCACRPCLAAGVRQGLRGWKQLRLQRRRCVRCQANRTTACSLMSRGPARGTPAGTGCCVRHADSAGHRCFCKRQVLGQHRSKPPRAASKAGKLAAFGEAAA